MSSAAIHDEGGTVPSPAGSHRDTASLASSSTATTFETYATLTHRALQRSRQSLDTRALIEMAYGEDALSVYGGSDMLVGILDDVLDKVASETAPRDFLDGYCRKVQADGDDGDEDGDNKSNGKSAKTVASTHMTPQQRLDHIDRTIRHVLEWEARRAEVETMDVSSTQASLERTLLPSGAEEDGAAVTKATGPTRSTASRGSASSIRTEDVVRYREHQNRLAVKLKLQEELQRVQEEIHALQERRAGQQAYIQERLDKVHVVEKELEVSANGLVPW